MNVAMNVSYSFINTVGKKTWNQLEEGIVMVGTKDQTGYTIIT